MNNRLQLSPDVFSKMQVGKPYKSYKKVVLGKVFVMYIDPFSLEPKGTELSGDPSKNDEGCFIDVWSEMEDAFFRRSNKKHFELRFIEETVRSVDDLVRTADDITDEEIEEALNTGFLKLRSILNQLRKVETAERILSVAEGNEKSEKIIGAIKARLSELQQLQAEGKVR